MIEYALASEQIMHFTAVLLDWIFHRNMVLERGIGITDDYEWVLPLFPCIHQICANLMQVLQTPFDVGNAWCTKFILKQTTVRTLVRHSRGGIRHVSETRKQDRIDARHAMR